ncbi:glycosyltransferase family 2 protein [Congregibacter variabilis]|uniref:Glycosyltransferase family 2 protein n=1 Tax=Congregibacter variabilis TaxID=3081200 RepID=A0ABZ0I7L7_9GAMM|nr:glycosyltransferase family 2 protein [Congregibacter sp. IMCC43200]
MNFFECNKVLLAGCAKDEAAYLPEWIFYHLKLGVSGILIYVNNTTDASEEMLLKIAEKHPVEYCIADGIELKPDDAFADLANRDYLRTNPIQSKYYADIYQKTSAADYDYILYLDIDEFLHFDCHSVNSTRKPASIDGDVINFRWFNLAGDTRNFVDLSQTSSGSYDEYTKFMVRTGLSDVKFQDAHLCTSDNSPGDIASHAQVLHRNLRSRDEYLALLTRRPPNTQNRLAFDIKQNRRGWSSRGQEQYPMNVIFFEGYSEQLCSFIETSSIQKLLSDAKSATLRKKEDFVAFIEGVQTTNTELGKVLFGTGLSHLSLRDVLRMRFLWRVLLLLKPQLIHQHKPISSKTIKGSRPGITD